MNFQNYTSFEQVVFIIIIINIAFSLMAFGNIRLFEKLKFRIGDIIGNKEYGRLLSSAFIHGSFMHLFFNMYVLHSFSKALGHFVTIPQFLVIYIVSLIIGNLLPLFIHRNNYNYSAVGASGAVSGVLYASIYFMPFGKIGIIFIPFGIDSWMFGILYLVYTVWAAKKGNDNIGHDAHFGGAVAGLLIAFLIKPAIAFENWLIILAMMAPIVYFLFDIFKGGGGPNVLSKFKRLDKNANKYSNRSVDDLYNYDRRNQIRELNELLEKVDEKGLQNISVSDKKKLDELGKALE
jgi:membrane associated rhomboid family serine protease